MLPLNRTFQDLFNDILYFSVDQIYVEFVIFACLSNRGKVWMENENVYAEVVFNYILTLWSFWKILFSKTIVALKLKLSG